MKKTSNVYLYVHMYNVHRYISACAKLFDEGFITRRVYIKNIIFKILEKKKKTWTI